MPSSFREPPILLMASRYDFSVDYVVGQLRRREVGYFRLNTEDLPALSITLDPVARSLEIRDDSSRWRFAPESLRSVYFRRPVFLREFGKARTTTERFSLPQWAAFERSLMLLEEALWVNAPDAIYRAESKALQLATASECGLSVPKTFIGNSVDDIPFRFRSDTVALKSLDVVHIEHNAKQTFAYTQLIDKRVVSAGAKSAPAIYQEALDRKLDLRVTVVGDQVFTASITDQAGEPVSGDWRVHKESLRFAAFALPEDIERKAIELTRRLGLLFGGIDLAVQDGEYHFIEINPTGEWSWLVDTAGLGIDTAITDVLCGWCERR